MVFFYLCCFLPVFFSVSLLQTCRKQSNASIWSIFISFSVCSCQSVINVDDRASGSGLNPGWTDAQKAAERRLIRSRRWILASHSWVVFCSSFPVPSCPHLAPSIVFYLAGKAAAGLKQNMIYLQLRFQRLRVGFCVKTRGNSRLKAGGIQVVLEDVELVKLCSPFSSKSNKKRAVCFLTSWMGNNGLWRQFSGKSSPGWLHRLWPQMDIWTLDLRRIPPEFAVLILFHAADETYNDGETCQHPPTPPGESEICH